MNPVRTCIGCRQSDNRANLQRFVLGPVGPVLDPRKSLPGRGAWVHQQCLKLAEERGAIARALRRRKQEKAEKMLAKNE